MDGKLVRDRIPEIIKNNGEEPVTRIASSDEYHDLLVKKLEEEVGEFKESKEAEELADILEVIHALCDSKNISREDLEDMRKKKAKERGGFSKRIVLRTSKR